MLDGNVPMNTYLERISGLSDESKNLMTSFLQLNPRAELRPQTHLDFKVGLEYADGTTFENIGAAFAEEEEGLVSEIGESRMAFYLRSIGVIAPLATRVEILDRYASDALLSSSAWLIDALLKNSKLEVVIHTQLPEAPRNFSWTREERQSAVERAIQERLASSPKYAGTTRIYTYSKPKHHRWIRFVLEHGSLVVGLPNGIADFSFDPIREPTPLATLPQSSFTSAKKAWEIEGDLYRATYWHGKAKQS
jgi:hypothetical protein